MAEEVEFVVTDWEYQDAGTDDWQEWDLTANFRITNPTPYPAKVLYLLRGKAKPGRTSAYLTLESNYTDTFYWKWVEEDLLEVDAGESLVRSVNTRMRTSSPEDLLVVFENVGVVSMFGEHDSGAEPYWLELRRQGHTYRC